MATTKNATQPGTFACWPKTHTAQQAIKHLLQTEALCDLIGITPDEWRMLLFEAGCRWAEAKHADNPKWAALQLQSPEWGYWATFMRDWLEHDELLLKKAASGMDLAGYCAAKEAYLKSTDIIW